MITVAATDQSITQVVFNIEIIRLISTRIRPTLGPLQRANLP